MVSNKFDSINTFIYTLQSKDLTFLWIQIMVEQIVGLVMDSVMIWTTMRPATMMMVIVVDYLLRKTFVLTAFVKVNQTALHSERNWFTLYFLLVFRCKNDDDCSGNGYCHVGECECLPNNEYALDCSHYGCK